MTDNIIVANQKSEFEQYKESAEELLDEIFESYKSKMHDCLKMSDDAEDGSIKSRIYWERAAIYMNAAQVLVEGRNEYNI